MQQQDLLVETLKAEMSSRLALMEAKLASNVAVSDDQLSALQARIEVLQSQKLLADQEVFAIEDLCADWIELEASVGKLSTEVAQTHHAGATVCKLVALSEKMLCNTAFARQLRRKILKSF
eukprot:SAG31_NODE_5211_length_2673_cov_3.479409_1_plen_121_part_00